MVQCELMKERGPVGLDGVEGTCRGHADDIREGCVVGLGAAVHHAIPAASDEFAGLRQLADLKPSEGLTGPLASRFRPSTWGTLKTLK